MNPAELDALSAVTKYVALPCRTVIEEPGQLIGFAYFFEAGLCSIVVEGNGRAATEAGHIGPEEASGSSIVLRSGISANRLIMQMPGRAWRIPASELVRAAR